MVRPTRDVRSSRQRRTAIRVVVVDDDASDRERIAAIVRGDVVPVEIREVTDHVGFFHTLKDPDFDLLITEQDLHWSSGKEVLTAVKSLKPSIPVIMVARFENEAVAAAALREGLEAYIPKSGELAIRLRSSVRSALQKMEVASRADSLETRLQDLLDSLNVGVFRTSMNGRFIEANAAFLRLVGVPSSRALRDLTRFEVFVDAAVQRGLRNRLEGDGQIRDFQAEMRRRDGAKAWVSLTVRVRPSLGGDGVADGLVEDVTLARRAQEAIRRANEDYRSVFEITNSASIILEDDTTIGVVNSSYESMSGYAREELEGKRSWSDFVVAADRERVREQLRQLQLEPDATPRTARFDLVHRSGRPVHVFATLAPLIGSGRIVVSLLNQTARQQVEQQLLHNAFHDALTGLPNRLSMLDRMETLVSSASSRKQGAVALVLVGLDRFRMLNDCLGHRVGDLLLQAVTRRLERAVPAADTVSRCGGDVFGVILHPVEGIATATTAADAIRTAFDDPFTFGEHVVHCTASMGIVACGVDRDTNELFREAEAALYEAKRTGRDRWLVFEPSMIDRAWHAFTIENDLRRALKNHEFRLHFQPIGALADGRIAGFEALLRWQRPGGDLMLPEGFLQVAEDTGLIVPIGREVLRIACRQLERWCAWKGPADGMFVSINLSARQLRHPALVADIGAAIKSSGIDAADLMIEISEGLLSEGEGRIPDVIVGLRELGVQLCLDSFGTGGLSLAELHRYPFTTVKIDRSFLAGIGDDEKRWRMVDGLHALAINLGLRVILEGIEERDQLRRLLELGCCLGQGTLFSGPVDETEADRILRAHQKW
jgi:diguanylate cyclase (GGDEF)-like protein/PAS domain S-box-containing protein